MGKGARLKRQRKAAVEVSRESEAITPVNLEDVKFGHSYWITGYYWQHDTVIVEPFCAVSQFGKLVITNLDKNDMDYFEATVLLQEPDRLLIFEDRVQAIRICDALRNEKTLLDSFAEYMSDEDLVEYLEGKQNAK